MNFSCPIALLGRSPRLRPAFLCILAALLVCACSASAQSDTDGAKIVNFMVADNYSYHTTRSPKTWFVEYNGNHLKDMKVVISYGGDPPQIVVFVTLVKKQRLPVTIDFMRTLLQQDELYDRVKIGFDSDGDLAVRTDAALRITDAQEFREIVTQVERASDELYGIIEPSLLP